MKRKAVWPWWVLGVLVLVLVLSLTFSCMSSTKPTNTPFGLQPPVDIKNNVTGLGSIASPMSDGVPDLEWVAWKTNVEFQLNSLTGGLFSGWMKIVGELAGVTALALSTWNKIKGDADHKNSIKEIALTDENVQTIAVAAKVPSKDLV